MKKYIKYIFSTFFIAFISCNDHLDVVPDQRLEIDNIEKLEATLVGAYNNSRGYRFTHFSSDDVELAEDVFSDHPIIEDLYTWSKDIRNQTDQDSPSEFWRSTYRSIAQANLVLEKASLIKVVTTEESVKLSLIIAEAKLLRSYYHFMLVNIFGKHYNTSSSQDLGVPYVEKVENSLNPEYKRQSVEEVYNKSEQDLLDAINSIQKDNTSFKNNKYRFTLATMYAYAARFYAFRNRDAKDQDEVIKYAAKSLDYFQGKNNLPFLEELNSNPNATIDIQRSDVGMVQYSWSFLPFNYVYQSTFNIKKILEKNPLNLVDLRFAINYTRSGNVFIPANYFVFNSQNIGIQAVDVFPLVEVILNKAEAHIRKEEFQQAKDLLSEIGEKCYENYEDSLFDIKTLLSFYETTSVKDAWTQYLLHERRNSLFLKGFRWFDLKRYNMDVSHKLKDGTVISLLQTLPNKAYQIPSYAISNGITPNN